eukprot:6199461-Pleurochrysis_carterae.AAC.2
MPRWAQALNRRHHEIKFCRWEVEDSARLSHLAEAGEAQGLEPREAVPTDIEEEAAVTKDMTALRKQCSADFIALTTEGRAENESVESTPCSSAEPPAPSTS